jgi:hypothetical protein
MGISNNVALDLARHRVQAYADESVGLMAQHTEAMDCRDCEDFLKLGVDAFQWLTRADDMLSAAAHDGLLDFTPELRAALGELYESWLRPCDAAERWIATLEQAGFTPEHLAEFRAACEVARNNVERQQWQEVTARARQTASADEPW